MKAITMQPLLLVACTFFVVFVRPATAPGDNDNVKDATEKILNQQQPHPLERRYNDASTESLADGRGNHSGHCHSILKHLSKLAGSLTSCFLFHSRPFRACEKCVRRYARYTHSYRELMKDDKCKMLMSMADRMRFYSVAYTTFTSAWASSSCHTCFDNIEVNSTTGQVTFNYTKEAQFIMKMGAEVSSCFKDHSNEINPSDNVSKACYECRGLYGQLKNNFSALYPQKMGEVCMDIVDMMNGTWFMWSTRFNCPRPQVNPVVLIAFSVFLGIVTVCLYAGSKLVAEIRMPEIVSTMRMKTCRSQRHKQRYGTSSHSTAATAHVQGVERRQLEPIKEE